MWSDSPECQQRSKIDWTFCFHALNRYSSSRQKITRCNWCTVTAQVIYIKKEIYNARQRGRKNARLLGMFGDLHACWDTHTHTHALENVQPSTAAHLWWICVAQNTCLINTKAIWFELSHLYKLVLAGTLIQIYSRPRKRSRTTAEKEERKKKNKIRRLLQQAGLGH